VKDGESIEGALKRFKKATESRHPFRDPQARALREALCEEEEEGHRGQEARVKKNRRSY